MLCSEKQAKGVCFELWQYLRCVPLGFGNDNPRYAVIGPSKSFWIGHGVIQRHSDHSVWEYCLTLLSYLISTSP